VADVKLTTFPNWTEAEMFAQILRAEGIPSILIPLAPFDGWGSSTWSDHELRVSAAEADRARALLAEWQDGAGDVVLPGEG
jgi:hypothetical protein